ncbi:MAG: 50S ribosomal protein L6, partial [Flavobacteriales bacterium]|nr:50S ribosomal protein L6 [Flavobacteriales bacterium]
MSRVGKSPIIVPDGVTLSIEGATVTVKGPKGELQEVIHPDIT